MRNEVKKYKSARIRLWFSFILAVSLSYFAGFGLEDKIVKFQQEFHLKSLVFNKEISLPAKSDYMLKLKYDYQFTDTEIVKLNSNTLELTKGIRRKSIRTHYYSILQEDVRESDNKLMIKFYPAVPFQIDLRIRNFIRSSFDNNLIFASRDSLFVDRSLSKILLAGLLFFIFSSWLWKVLVYTGKQFFKLPHEQSFFNVAVAFMAHVLFFVFLGLGFFLLNFIAVVHPFYLFMIFLTSVISVVIFLNFVARSIITYPLISAFCFSVLNDAKQALVNQIKFYLRLFGTLLKFINRVICVIAQRVKFLRVLLKFINRVICVIVHWLRALRKFINRVICVIVHWLRALRKSINQFAFRLFKLLQKFLSRFIHYSRISIFIRKIKAKTKLFIVRGIPVYFEQFLSWVKSLEFSGKCIFLSAIFLLICSNLLIFHLEFPPKLFANMAYYALVIGVIIKFIKFVRRRRESRNF